MALTGAIYMLNALVIYAFSPQSDWTAFKSEFGSVQVYEAGDLNSGGAWVAQDTEGYVNLAEEAPIIYVDANRVEKSPHENQSSPFISHEIAHIQQKRLIAGRAGGYPSYANPWQTAKFLYYTLKLNHDYTQIMPEPKNAQWWRAGLESAADCYSVSDDDTGHYVDQCNKDQRKQAFRLISGKWPETH